MNIKNRRFFAILALFLLTVMFFGIIMHESSSHALHGVTENNALCSMCIIGEQTFKALIPAIIGTAFTAVSFKIVVRSEKAEILSKTRNFPLLC